MEKAQTWCLELTHSEVRPCDKRHILHNLRVCIVKCCTMSQATQPCFRTSCQQLRQVPRWAQDARNNRWPQRWRDATQSGRLTNSSHGSPWSRDNFFFLPPLQIREDLTITEMPITPHNQQMAALFVHRVGVGRDRLARQRSIGETEVRIREFVLMLESENLRIQIELMIQIFNIFCFKYIYQIFQQAN